MGSNRACFRVLYRNYVEQNGRDEISAFYQQQKHAPILGDKHFKADVLKKARPQNHNQEVAAIERVNDSPDVKKIVRIVARTFEVPMQSVWYAERGRNRNVPRLTAMYLSQQIQSLYIKWNRQTVSLESLCKRCLVNPQPKDTDGRGQEYQKNCKSINTGFGALI